MGLHHVGPSQEYCLLRRVATGLSEKGGLVLLRNLLRQPETSPIVKPPVHFWSGLFASYSSALFILWFTIGIALAVCLVPETAAEPERHAMLCLLSPGFCLSPEWGSSFQGGLEYSIPYILPVRGIRHMNYSLTAKLDYECDKLKKNYIYSHCVVSNHISTLCQLGLFLFCPMVCHLGIGTGLSLVLAAAIRF